MKEFNIGGRNIEWLLATKIKANSLEEAKAKYFEMWENGDIEANKSDIEVFEVA